jgi:hypothetical protein
MSMTVIACLLVALFGLTNAQSSINPHDGFDIGVNVGVSVAISFGLLAILTGLINFLRYKVVNPRASGGGV